MVEVQQDYLSCPPMELATTQWRTSDGGAAELPVLSTGGAGHCSCDAELV